MTVTLYIGTFILILLLHSIIHKLDYKNHKISVILFFLLFFFCSFLYKPFFDLPIWLGLVVLFYVAFDDFLQESFNVIPVILLFIYINILNFSTINLLFSLGIFLILFLLSKKNLVGEGEAYILPVFVLLIGAENVFSFVYLSSVVGSLIFFFTSIVNRAKKEHPFVPTLMLAFYIIYTEHHSFQLVFWMTVLFFIGAFTHMTVNFIRKTRVRS